MEGNGVCGDSVFRSPEPHTVLQFVVAELHTGVVELVQDGLGLGRRAVEVLRGPVLVVGNVLQHQEEEVLAPDQPSEGVLRVQPVPDLNRLRLCKSSKPID